MAGYGGNEYWNQNQSYNFEVPESFGNELNFQSFNANQVNAAPNSYTSNQAPHPTGAYLDPSLNANYSGDVFASDNSTQNYGQPNEFDDEPPLLEELGINPQQIFQKTLSVLNPFRTTNSSILQDTDLAGPLVFCLALGGFLLLRGKVSFSHIYGIGVLGCIAFYGLLSLMSTKVQVTFGVVVSVLGYCLLPMVALSGLNVIISIQGLFGTVLSGLCILWCAFSASKLFVTAYPMENQQILVAYPCALLYGVFGLITIF